MQTRMNILLADDDEKSVIRLKELFHDTGNAVAFGECLYVL